MDSNQKRHSAPPHGLDARSTLGKVGLKALDVKLGGLAVTLAFLFGAAAYVSTYLSFEGSAAEPSALLSRASTVNAATAALLSLVTVFVAGLVVARRITSSLEKFSHATREASAGNLDVRVDAFTSPVFEELARSFNAMMDRMSETARSEAGQKQSLLAIIKAVESSGDAIAVADSTTEGTYYNKKFTELFGYNVQELDAAASKALLYVDAGVAREVSEAVSNGASWSGEIEMRARSGRIIPVALRSDAIKDESGRVTGHIEIHTDITQRKRAELLQSALYRVAEMTSSTDDMQVFFGAVHRIVGELMYAGNFFIALYDEATQMVSFPYYVDEVDAPPQPRKLRRGMTEHVLRSGTALLAPRENLQAMIGTGEIEVIGTLPVGWLGIPLKAGDETVGVLAVQSYTESVRFGETEKDVLTFVSQHIASALNRRRAEEALRQGEEKYRTILESIEDGYFEVDLKGNFTFFNGPVCKMLGYEAEELMGMNNRQFMDPDVAQQVYQEFSMVARTGEASRGFSYEVIAKDGTKRVVESSVSLKRDASGKPDGFRGIKRDVTARRLAEESLERNLKEFLTMVSSVSEGDLTKRGGETDNTLGRVIQSVNKMLDDFSLMLTEVKQIGLSVSSSATEILAAAEQIAVGSQRQADEITNTSSAVEEMAASMNQVSKNADASADAARRALDKAEHGDKSVRDTSEAMSRIDSAVQQTAEKMRLLGIRSSEISEIIDLIDEIAAQTNLLALNAAIEAAHAGEAGLGFSVVADEIRKLAERSARATRDVGNLIKSIQNETSEALTAMEVGMKEVRGGSYLANEASTALRDISEAVRQSSELIEEISAASEEQARVTSNVAGAMQTISSITLETSAGAHQTAQTIEGMVGLADRLNKAISQFKVKDDYIHPFSYDLPGSSGNRGNGTTIARYPHGD
ncbi:MAG: methyl-accepting chemotaxis protein [Acidobacteriota bacterium]